VVNIFIRRIKAVPLPCYVVSRSVNFVKWPHLRPRPSKSNGVFYGCFFQKGSRTGGERRVGGNYLSLGDMDLFACFAAHFFILMPLIMRVSAL
jgi:hypothetical protein